MSISIFFGIFCIVIGSILIFMCGMIWNEGDSEGIGLALFSFIVVLMGVFFIFVEVSEDYYKQGQVDALSGDKIQYELKVQQDSSRIWVEKNED